MEIKTAGIIPAAGYSLADGLPKVLLPLNGIPILKRAIDAHFAAEFEKVVVVVNSLFAEQIWLTINAQAYGKDLIWSVQHNRHGNADAVLWALCELFDRKIHPQKIIVSLGDMGLWQAETLIALRMIHLRDTRFHHAVMAMASVRLGCFPHVFKHYGLISYANDANAPETSAHPRSVHEYWCEDNGHWVDSTAKENVNPSLYCLNPKWVENNFQSLPFHASRDAGLSPEKYLSDLVPRAHQYLQPALDFHLSDQEACQALGVNNLDQLLFVQAICDNQKTIIADLA